MTTDAPPRLDPTRWKPRSKPDPNRPWDGAEAAAALMNEYWPGCVPEGPDGEQALLILEEVWGPWLLEAIEAARDLEVPPQPIQVVIAAKGIHPSSDDLGLPVDGWEPARPDPRDPPDTIRYQRKRPS